MSGISLGLWDMPEEMRQVVRTAQRLGFEVAVQDAGDLLTAIIERPDRRRIDRPCPHEGCGRGRVVAAALDACPRCEQDVAPVYSVATPVEAAEVDT